MIGSTIGHYKILEKLGEVPIRPAKLTAGRLDLASAAALSPFVGLRIPACLVGTFGAGRTPKGGSSRRPI